MLGNVELEVHRPPDRVVVAAVWLMQKRYEIGILFNRAAFAQVGQAGPGVRALLHGAGELGAGNDGDVEFAGQRLERARDLGDLLYAVFAVARSRHQLEIVNDQ